MIENITPSHPLDWEAIRRDLEECAGEIDARIAELEKGQFISHEILQLEFGI